MIFIRDLKLLLHSQARNIVTGFGNLDEQSTAHGEHLSIYKLGILRVRGCFFAGQDNLHRAA